MNIRDLALKEILKHKMKAENLADRNLDKVLENEDIKVLFLACKRLVVEIAKLEVAGQDSSAKREEYNHNREIIAQLLKQKGIDKKDLKPQYNCEKCKDSGMVNVDICDCLKREMSKQLIRLSGVDISSMPKFNNDFSIFSNPEEIKCIYSKMKKFINDLDKTSVDLVLIVGGTGVGKTHLIGCMTTYAISKCVMLKYTTAFNFNQEMLKYHCSKIEEKEDLMDSYLNSELLFIDDLGSENKIKNVTNEYLYLIINERMQNHKKTVITTNLSFEQIQDVYGERIFSRLMHKKQSLKIKFPGEDIRVNLKK